MLLNPVKGYMFGSGFQCSTLVGCSVSPPATTVTCTKNFLIRSSIWFVEASEHLKERPPPSSFSISTEFPTDTPTGSVSDCRSEMHSVCIIHNAHEAKTQHSGFPVVCRTTKSIFPFSPGYVYIIFRAADRTGLDVLYPLDDHIIIES